MFCNFCFESRLGIFRLFLKQIVLKSDCFSKKNQAPLMALSGSASVMVLVLSIVTLHGKIQQNSGTSWVISIHRNFQAFSAIQSNLYKNDTQGTWKCALYDQLSFIYRLKLYALFINGKKGGNKTLTFTLTICRRHETLMLEVGIRFQSYISDDRHVVTKSCQRPEPLGYSRLDCLSVCLFHVYLFVYFKCERPKTYTLFSEEIVHDPK